MAVIYPFGEGIVEKVVFEFLTSTIFSENKFQQFNTSGGKSRFIAKIIETVESNIDAKLDEIRVIAFRDLDHGETIENICQSFQRIVHKLLSSWETKPKAEEIIPESVYKWEVGKNEEPPGFKFVLHVARVKDLAISIRNQTTDAYILQLGLSEQVLKRFAEESKVRSNYETVNKLITSSIPYLIKENDISFDEDKDYLAAYLVATRFWVIKRTEARTRLIKIILERGWQHNREGFKKIFDSWIKAINEVVR